MNVSSRQVAASLQQPQPVDPAGCRDSAQKPMSIDGGPRSRVPATTDSGHVVAEMRELCEELFPICRSITGPGLRETLERISCRLPLDVSEVATGTNVLDWTVPQEWRARDAAICDRDGRRLVDFRDSNLHLVNYSVPVDRWMGWDELNSHLHSLPDHPDWIPYRTSYYEPNWGFCLSHRRRIELAERARRDAGSGSDRLFHVYIDAELIDGALSYGEWVLPGASDEEVLLSSHVCHPSLANDNLSAIAVAVQVGLFLRQAPRRYTYRMLFAPGTIGAITWLARNRDRLPRIRHGMVLALMGGDGPLSYKRSRGGDHEVDRVARRVLAETGESHRILDFSPTGYDERQFGSPGIDLPVGRLTRWANGEFPQYHTSADNLDLLDDTLLLQAFHAVRDILLRLEAGRRPRGLVADGEPQLGRRGLYAAVGNHANVTMQDVLWVLNLADGRNTHEDIAERSGMSSLRVADTLELLVQHDLVAEEESDTRGERTV